MRNDSPRLPSMSATTGALRARSRRADQTVGDADRPTPGVSASRTLDEGCDYRRLEQHSRLVNDVSVRESHRKPRVGLGGTRFAATPSAPEACNPCCAGFGGTPVFKAEWAVTRTHPPYRNRCSLQLRVSSKPGSDAMPNFVSQSSLPE